jgi:metallo-beta-lactamase class B
VEVQFSEQSLVLKLPAIANLRNGNAANFKDRPNPLEGSENSMRTILLTLFFTISLTNIFGQTEEVKLKISHLTGDFYIYTTYNTYEGSQLPANGMYIVTNNGVVMIDTPWDTTQFQPLVDSINFKHHKNVIMCIATHWHSDRTEGLEYYQQKGIKTFTTTLTDELSKTNHKKRAEYLIENDTLFNIGQYSFETYYPGQGHTEDNIVIWFGKEKILYGGCLIKGADAENLGYLGDATVTAYYATLKKVEEKFPNPEFIIISHSDWNNINSLKHSVKLAKKLKKENLR